MLSIKRAAGLGATVAAIAALGPVTGAGAATIPTPAPPVTVNPGSGDVSPTGSDATLAAWASQVDAALAGFNAGSTSQLEAFQATLAKLPAGSLAPGGAAIPAIYGLPAGFALPAGLTLPGR